MRQDDGLSIARQADLLGGQLDAGEIREVSAIDVCMRTCVCASELVSDAIGLLKAKVDYVS